MSLEQIIDLISQFRDAEDSPEIGWIKWRHSGCEQSIKQGVNIIESKVSNSISYKAYVVCVKNCNSLQSDEEDLTDAEEEITMTPMIISNKTRSNSFTTVVPDSDDGEDTDDSIGSIILASQENNKKKDVLKNKTITNSSSQIDQGNTLEKSSSIHLHLEYSVNDIHDVETQPIEINSHGKASNKDLVASTNTSSIHEAETQDFAHDNVFKRINLESGELPLESNALPAAKGCDENNKEISTLTTSEVSSEKTVQSHQHLEDTASSNIHTEEQLHVSTSNIPVHPSTIHEEETQQIFKVPESRKPPEETKPRQDDDDSLDVRDSQICDFDGFTEDFEIQASQSLLIDVGSVPEVHAPPKLPSIVEDDQLVAEDVKDFPEINANLKPKENDDLLDPSIDEEMADLDDEPTQIIAFDDSDAALGNKTLDIYEIATQVPVGLHKKTVFENDSSPDIYNMATQCVVKSDDVLNTSKDIYNALTQCITKQEVSDDDSTDIEDNIDTCEEQTTTKMETIAGAENSPEDDDDTLTQIIEPAGVDETVTKIAEEPQAVNNEVEIEKNQTCNKNDVTKIIDPEPCTSDAIQNCDDEDDDVYNLATQVIVTNKEHPIEICDVPNNRNSSGIDGVTRLGGSEDCDDIYNLATQVVVTDDVPNPNTPSFRASDVAKLARGNEDIFMAATQQIPERNLSNESLPSPISKMVFLTSENFSGETSIDSKNNHLNANCEKTHLGKKIIGSLNNGNSDNFTFSTPNKEPIKKKKKVIHNTVSAKDLDVTVALKKIVPTVEVTAPVNISDDNCYNNTQEVIADLMSTPRDASNTTSKPIEKDSPGKENSFAQVPKNIQFKQPNFYQSTQEVLNDLCTQKSTNKDMSFYNSTQELYNDLATQDKEFTKVPTPTKKVKLDVPLNASTQSSESSEEIFKSPLKRKIKYTISDSELDSPQIELYAAKMLSNLEVNSNSDYDDAPPEESQDTPVVFRKTVPSKKNKINPAKHNLHNKFDVLPAKNVVSAKNANVNSLLKAGEQSTSANNAGRKRLANLDEEDDVIPKPTTRNKKRFILDSDSTPNSEEMTKNINTANTKDHSKSISSENKDSRSKTRKGKIAEDTAEKLDTEIGTRRSSRVRKVNKKYEDADYLASVGSNNSCGDNAENSAKKISPRETRNNPADKELPKNKPADKELPKNKPADKELPKNKPADKELPRNKPTDKELPKNKPADKELPKNKSKRTSGLKGNNSSTNNESNVNIENACKRKMTKNNKNAIDVISGDSKNISRKYSGLKVMFTSLDSVANTLGQTIETLGGSVVDKDGDVLVAPQPCKRTVKVMLAAAKGIPIVSQQWVATCHKAGHFVDPWDHILKCNVLETKYKICLDKVLRTARPYLKGWLVYITPKVPMPFEQLKELVEACGGNAELVPKTANRRSMKILRGEVGTLSVSCMEDTQLWSVLPEPIVSMELLLQGSFTHEVRVNNYKLLTRTS